MAEARDIEVDLKVRTESLERLLVHNVESRAPWATHPCELYSYHAPVPTLTEGHHVHPVFLQNKLYGQIVDNELKYLCSNCHDSVHEWIYWLLGQRRNEPHVGRLAKEEAQRTYDWYIAEMERMGLTS